MAALPSILGVFTLLYTSHQCLQVPLLCPTHVTLASSGGTVAWTDQLAHVLVTQSLFDNHRIPLRDVPYNVYLGVEYDITTPRHTSQHQTKTSMTVQDTTTLLSSQGATSFVLTHRFQLSTNGETLTYGITSGASSSPHVNLTYTYQRSTNATVSSHIRSPPVPSVVGANTLERARSTSNAAPVAAAAPAAPTEPTTTPPTAYHFNVTDAWALNDPDFQQNAMVIGLQGLANRAGPNLYLTYPSNWSFSYTSAVKDYVSEHKYVSFTSLTTSMDVLRQFSSDVDKYVVWDPLVRDTLVVSTATTTTVPTP